MHADALPPGAHDPRSRWCASTGKRVFDVVVALALTMLTLPLVIVLAAGSALAFRAFPFFVHERVGRHGRPFRLVKIRSLPAHAPRYADKFALAEVTAWGRFLRASHLDEIPQLWLVLAGRMSLVGPRPEMAEVAARFEPGFVAARAAVRPGCTGLWQVSESAHRLIGDDPRFDLHYLDRAHLGMDLAVLWRTFARLLGAPPLRYDQLVGPLEEQVAALGAELDRPTLREQLVRLAREPVPAATSLASADR